VFTLTAQDRRQRSEQLMKTIECAESAVASFLHNRNRYEIPLNIWDEVKQDTINIEEGERIYWHSWQVLADKDKYKTLWSSLYDTLMFYRDGWDSSLKWLQYR